MSKHYLAAYTVGSLLTSRFLKGESSLHEPFLVNVLPSSYSTRSKLKVQNLPIGPGYLSQRSI